MNKQDKQKDKLIDNEEKLEEYREKLLNTGDFFRDKLKNNLEQVRERVMKNKKASLLVVDGSVGSGKTTLAVEIADYLNLKISGEIISLKDQVATGGKEFISKMVKAHDSNNHVVVYDEAGDFSKRGALSKFNRRLNRVFETYRALKVIVILTLPSFKSLDKELMEKGILRGLLHCRDRTDKRGFYDGYSLWRAYYIKKKMDKITVPPQAYKYTRPNFYNDFHDLPSPRSERLENLSVENKIDILRGIARDSEGVEKGYLNYEELCDELDKSKNWIKRVISGLGIEPDHKTNKRNYFKPSVVDKLEGAQLTSNGEVVSSDEGVEG